MTQRMTLRQYKRTIREAARLQSILHDQSVWACMGIMVEAWIHKTPPYVVLEIAREIKDVDVLMLQIRQWTDEDTWEWEFGNRSICKTKELDALSFQREEAERSCMMDAVTCMTASGARRREAMQQRCPE